MRGLPTEAIVRVGAPHPDLIARLLDWGAHSSCMRSLMSIPRNKRNGSSRPPATRHAGIVVSRAPFPGAGFRLRPASDPMQDAVIMAQIETIKGVRQAGEIAQIDGINVLFVGPADLQFDLTHGTESASAPGGSPTA